jgi:hypothetical protein
MILKRCHFAKKKAYTILIEILKLTFSIQKFLDYLEAKIQALTENIRLGW